MAPETYQRLAEACDALSEVYGVPSPPVDDQDRLLAFLTEALVAVVHELPRNGTTAVDGWQGVSYARAAGSLPPDGERRK